MRTKRLRLNPLFLLVLMAALIGGYHWLFLIAYASALLHEGAHILTATALKVPIARLEIQPFGVCGVLKNNFIKSPAKEILIASVGPLTNFCIVCILTYLKKHFGASYYFDYAIWVNTAMMATNLIPSLPLDGGRIFKALLTLSIGGLKAYNLMIRISRVLIVAILGVAVFILLTSGFNFSLILIGVFMLGNLTNEQKNISVMTMKEIIYNKEKLLKDEINRVEYIAAYHDLPARKVIRSFTYHKYYMINVLSDEERVINTLSESQVIDALVNRSIRIRVGDI